MNILLIKKEDYLNVFSRIEEYIEGAAKYTFGRFTSNDIKNELLTKSRQLWVIFDTQTVYGFVITELSNYPQKKELVLHFTGGIEFNKWHKPILETLKTFAKKEQCDVIEFCGRSGWTKLFKQDGYKPIFTFYELPVEN
jgi:hypothetical protein